MTRTKLSSVAAAVLIAACGGPTGGGDAGSGTDGDVTLDAGRAADSGAGPRDGGGTDGGTDETPQFSSHFPSLHVLDFARNVKYIPDEAARNEAYDFLAAHVDVVEGQHDAIVSRDPDIRTFRYSLDLTTCQHEDCSYTHAPSTDTDSLPEEAFLHFSEETEVAFSEFGTDRGTVTIPGCPEGTPVTRDCRVQVWIWGDTRWVFAPQDESFRTWMTERLVAQAATDDGIFLDEHNPGFGRALLGDSTDVVSGGGVREYDGIGPSDELNSAFNADVVGALTVYRAALADAGKFLFVNTAGYALDPLAQDQAVAAGGVHVETMFRPDAFSGGQFQTFIDLARSVSDAGGMVDLVGSTCYWGPSEYEAGNYDSARSRYLMWRLAGYYMVREPAGGPGTVFFNPTFCIDYGSSSPLDFIDEWLSAYETDVGAPTGDARVLETGTAVCGYTIFARDYTNALVLVRSKDNWSCNDFGDATGASVDLPSAMRMLQADGSLGEAVTSVTLRNAEAVIMMR